jgi:hypothetical protein
MDRISRIKEIDSFIHLFIDSMNKFFFFILSILSILLIRSDLNLRR